MLDTQYTVDFGFAIHVFWTAVKETRRASRFSPYIFMIWLEILANTTYAIIAWLYLAEFIPPSIWFFLACIICWIAQVQCLMLIIVNRLCILFSAPRKRALLKYSVAGLVTLISISTACIWIPAQLQINHTYIRTDKWYDRFEKSIYLLLDVTLNILFIRLVKGRLVDHGLTKYNKVMKFNQHIIVISVGMDILLLGVTGLRNPFVYTQFHPITYIVKLQIEMTMSQLLIRVARSTGINVYNEEKGHVSTESYSRGTAAGTRSQGPVAVHIDTHIYTHGEAGYEFEMDNRDSKPTAQGSESTREDIKINDATEV
ncbi:hypothetical protein CPB85DRAFT_1430726 [Mucidula mucida]|nr:hypothetical protein CPB85DRAFT_1430726 [Mucidula mucida]